MRTADWPPRTHRAQSARERSAGCVRAAWRAIIKSNYSAARRALAVLEIEGEILSDVALAIVAASGNTPSTLLGGGDDAPEQRWRCIAPQNARARSANAITAAQPNARFRVSEPTVTGAHGNGRDAPIVLKKSGVAGARPG